MPRPRRAERLNELLKQEIALVLRSEVADPRAAGATITHVEASPELDHAKIYVNALGDEAGKEQIVSGLQSAASFIRGRLGRRLHLRKVPELHFHIDHRLEQAARIEQLLRDVAKDPNDA